MGETKITMIQLAGLIRILYDSKNAGSKQIREKYVGDFMIKNPALKPTLKMLCNMHDHEEAPKKEEPPKEVKKETTTKKKD